MITQSDKQYIIHLLNNIFNEKFKFYKGDGGYFCNTPVSKRSPVFSTVVSYKKYPRESLLYLFPSNNIIQSSKLFNNIVNKLTNDFDEGFVINIDYNFYIITCSLYKDLQNFNI